MDTRESPDLSTAPTIPDNTTPEQRIALWVDLMDACEQFLLAGLCREIGPDGDLQAAYREWYRQQMEEHDQMILHMVEEFHRRGGDHAR